MPENKYPLPQYPVTSDMWDEIKSGGKPIVVYGMGNGADKLIQRLEKIGASVSDFFASDGFVRGHSFHGKRVKSFSEIKAEYSDFVILLSFASNRDEVLDLLTNIDKENDLYIPDMPVCGQEYFDKDFYNANYDDIISAYNLLADERSREIFSSVIAFKLTGRLAPLLSVCDSKADLYSLIGSVSTALDLGAYNGDTVRELISFCPEVKKIIAVEPDAKNFKRLEKYITDNALSHTVSAINCAVGDSVGQEYFSQSGNRNSSVGSTRSYENKLISVNKITVDSLSLDRCDYIKYDVEGAEADALVGAYDTISKHLPTLLISAYHKSQDIFSLVLYIKKTHPEYNLYLRRIRCVPAWEMDIICKAR